MHARRGQDGNVEIRNGAFWGRYWKDQSDGTRKRPRVKLAPINSMTYSQAQRMWSQRLEEMGVNSIETFQRTIGPTFRQQAEVWFKQMQIRRRKPVKPSVLGSWRLALDRHLFPIIGDFSMVDVHNGALREVVSKLVEKGLSAQSIITYTRPLKMIVDSAKDGKGNSLYPVKWDNEFADLPIIQPELQRRPSITAQQIEVGLSVCRLREKALAALLAGSGLRIGEALGLQTRHIGKDADTVTVEQAVWEGCIQSPKSPAARRCVDIAPELADVLRRFAAGKGPNDFLFATDQGRVLSRHNVARTLRSKFGGGGFHRLRRFRAERLREAGVPDLLVKYWLGHSRNGDLSDQYAQHLVKNESYRREWSAKVELGFDLGGSNWTQLLDPPASTPNIARSESVMVASI